MLVTELPEGWAATETADLGDPEGPEVLHVEKAQREWPLAEGVVLRAVADVRYNANPPEMSLYLCHGGEPVEMEPLGAWDDLNPPEAWLLSEAERMAAFVLEAVRLAGAERNENKGGG